MTKILSVSHLSPADFVNPTPDAECEWIPQAKPQEDDFSGIIDADFDDEVVFGFDNSEVEEPSSMFGDWWEQLREYGGES